MKGYTVKEVAPGLYELKGPNRTIMLEGYEVTAILDFFREREWESGIRDALDDGCYVGDPIEDEDSFVADCVDEIRSKYEIYGDFNGDYKSVIESML